MSFIKTTDLALGYNKQPVIENLNLLLPAAKLVALVGPNGSGKTTLLKGLARLLKPLKGKIFWGDKNILEFSLGEIAKIYGYLAQIENYFEDDLTVREIVSLGRYPHLKYSWFLPDDEKEKINRVLKITETEHLAPRPLAALSGGELQKVRLARVLVQNPEVMFLDEPTLHLDIKTQFFILKLLKKLLANPQSGLKGVIASFHDLNQVTFFADEVILLSQGKIVSQGPAPTVITPKNITQVYGPEIQLKNIEGTNYWICLPS